MVECILIGAIRYTVEQRLVSCNEVTRSCCKRQFIEENNKKFFYMDYLNWSLHKDLGIIYDLNNIPSSICINIAQYLEEMEVSVKVVPELDQGKDLLKKYIEQGTRVVVISSGTIYNAIPLKRAIKVIRKISSDIHIIVCGNYIYNKWKTSSQKEWEDLKNTLNADFYITNAFEKESIYKLIKKCIKGPLSADSEDLNDIKTTCGKGVIKFKYFDYTYENMAFVNTSVGCTSKCSFCNFPIRNSSYKVVDYEVLDKWLGSLAIADVEFLSFSDDTFNAPKKHFLEVCKILKKYHFKWFAYCRIKEMDSQTLDLMKDSGCLGVYVGIESGNNTILKNMNKGCNTDDIKKSVQLLRNKGFIICAFLIVGFPGETDQTVEQTIKFINNLKIDFFTANLWYADISTPVFAQKEKFLLKGEGFEWRHFTMNSVQASHLTDIVMKSIKNSMWVPNENFGFQGIVYLLSRGYSVTQVKDVIKGMNNILFKQV